MTKDVPFEHPLQQPGVIHLRKLRFVLPEGGKQELLVIRAVQAGPAPQPQFGRSAVFPVVPGLPLAVNAWFILYTLFSPRLVCCQSGPCCSSPSAGKAILPRGQQLSSLSSSFQAHSLQIPKAGYRKFPGANRLHEFTYYRKCEILVNCCPESAIKSLHSKNPANRKILKC